MPSLVGALAVGPGDGVVIQSLRAVRVSEREPTHRASRSEWRRRAAQGGANSAAGLCVVARRWGMGGSTLRRGRGVTERLLILRQRTARRRARPAAEAEVAALLRGLAPRVLAGGPLAERGGRIWVAIEDEALEEAVRRLPRLGYCDAVDLLETVDDV